MTARTSHSDHPLAQSCHFGVPDIMSLLTSLVLGGETAASLANIPLGLHSARNGLSGDGVICPSRFRGCVLLFWLEISTTALFRGSRAKPIAIFENQCCTSSGGRTRKANTSLVYLMRARVEGDGRRYPALRRMLRPRILHSTRLMSGCGASIYDLSCLG